MLLRQMRILKENLPPLQHIFELLNAVNVSFKCLNIKTSIKSQTIKNYYTNQWF